MAAAAAASSTATLSLTVLVIMMIMVVGMPVASAAALSIVGMLVIMAVPMAAAAAAAFVIMAVAAAAALRLRLVDDKLDFLESELLADAHDEIRRAVIRQVGRAELNLHRFVAELREGLGHLAIEDEGEVGIHLVLKLGELFLAACPLAGFVHGEYDLIRGGIEGHGIENRRIFKSGHKFAGWNVEDLVPDGRPPLIEEEIHEHAGDGDVVPEGERPARPGPMPVKVPFERMAQGDDHQRHDGDGQQNVGDEHPVVNPTDRALAAKRRMHATDEDLVDHVGDEKDHRHTEGREHRHAMGRGTIRFDQDKTSRQQHRGDAVETGVDCG